MFRETIKAELDQRGWSVRRLADETGVRYASLIDYLNEKKDLSGSNLEKVLITLKLRVNNTGVLFRAMLEDFNGTELKYNHVISECDFAHRLLGCLINSACEHLQNEMKGYQISYGDGYDRFVSKIRHKDKNVVDISQSLCKREFVRIAEMYFNEVERNTYAMLCLYEYPEDCDREYMEVHMLGAWMGHHKLG